MKTCSCVSSFKVTKSFARSSRWPASTRWCRRTDRRERKSLRSSGPSSFSYWIFDLVNWIVNFILSRASSWLWYSCNLKIKKWHLSKMCNAQYKNVCQGSWKMSLLFRETECNAVGSSCSGACAGSNSSQGRKLFSRTCGQEPVYITC